MTDKGSDLKVEDYSDYREYLRDLLDEKKGQIKEFSLRWLAKKAGIPSNSHIVRVINGEINLTIPAAVKYLRALDVDQYDILKFGVLLSGGKAVRTQEVRRLTPQQMIAREYIRLLTFRDDFVANEHWIFKSIGKCLPIQDITVALNDLIDHLELRLDGDRWVPKVASEDVKPIEVMVGSMNHHVALAQQEYRIHAGSIEFCMGHQGDLEDLFSDVFGYLQKRLAELEKKNKGCFDQNRDLATIAFSLKIPTAF